MVENKTLQDLLCSVPLDETTLTHREKFGSELFYQLVKGMSAYFGVPEPDVRFEFKDDMSERAYFHSVDKIVFLNRKFIAYTEENASFPTHEMVYALAHDVAHVIDYEQNSYDTGSAITRLSRVPGGYIEPTVVYGIKTYAGSWGTVLERTLLYEGVASAMAVAYLQSVGYFKQYTRIMAPARKISDITEKIQKFATSTANQMLSLPSEESTVVAKDLLTARDTAYRYAKLEELVRAEEESKTRENAPQFYTLSAINYPA